jgi:hypothetical protein
MVLFFFQFDIERMLDKYGLPLVFTFALFVALKAVMQGAYGIINDYINTLKENCKQCEDIRKTERAEFMESVKENTAITARLDTTVRNLLELLNKRRV